MMDDAVPLGSREYFIYLVLLLFSRGMDLLSTRVATPGLLLEANPLARKLGWKGGIIFNLALCLGLASSSFTSIALATMSLLVAAHNLHHAWAMRSLGEHQYSEVVKAQLRQTKWSLYLACLFSECSLVALVGGAVFEFSGNALVPAAAGAGIFAFAFAKAFFSFLSVWPMRRSMG